MNDVKVITKKLLKLSKLIVSEFRQLSDLSYHNLEDTTQFLDHVSDITDYLNQEIIILNSLSLDKLEEIRKYLIPLDDDSEEYERCYVDIDEKIEELLANIPRDNEEDNISDLEDDDNEEDNEEDIDINCDQEEDNHLTTIDDYYISEEDCEGYANYVIDRIAIIAIKQMTKHIDKTLADNKRDIKYKRRLLKEFRAFKYIFFRLDSRLERLGAKYEFDVSKIPYLDEYNIELTPIYHNQTVTILDKLYSVNYDEKDISIVIDALFNMLCFDEYIKEIDDESLDKLIELCQVLKKNVGDKSFGEFGFKKLIKKKNNR